MEYKQCSGRVDESGGWGRTHQCSKRAVVERDGKPYCKIHDPEYIKAKDKKREERYQGDCCGYCGYHFPYRHYGYCPLCGTRRNKKNV